VGLGIGGAISVVGIALAYYFYVAQPATPAILIRRLRPIYTLFADKWYFDEAIDLLVVRPALAIGRFANRTFERVVVGGLVSGAAETVRGAGGIVRLVQSGFVRSYALLLIAGFAGLALYFLLASS
jgi:NADH-quinone oxidoreductase subunit L